MSLYFDEGGKWCAVEDGIRFVSRQVSTGIFTTNEGAIPRDPALGTGWRGVGSRRGGGSGNVHVYCNAYLLL